MIIKKIGVIITSLIFVTTLSLIPVKADEIVSTEIDTYSPTLTEEEQKEIKGAKYLLEYLRQGGSIDLSNKSSGYTAIDLIDDIADFFNGTLAQALGDEGYWINNISETQVPEYIRLKEPKISSEVNMMFGLLPFLVSDSDVPTVQPDNNYTDEIDWINGTGFYFKNYNNHYQEYFPNGSYSWFIGKSSNSFSNSSNNPIVGMADIFSIYIYSVNDLYQYTVSVNALKSFTEYNNYIGRYYYGQVRDDLNYVYSNNQVNLNGSTISNGVYNETYSGTLQDVFNHLKLKYKNVNIYVNDVCWSYVGGTTSHIDLGQGTYIENTNQPIQYDTPEGTQIDLTDLIDRLNILIANQNKIKFPDLSDLIVDEDGQQAFAVVVVNKDLTVDDWYVTNYGTLIPLFPVFVDYPVSMTDITTIATVGVKDVIPNDILEVLGIALVGMLFVTWIHRLLE